MIGENEKIQEEFTALMSMPKEWEVAFANVKRQMKDVLIHDYGYVCGEVTVELLIPYEGKRIPYFAFNYSEKFRLVNDKPYLVYTQTGQSIGLMGVELSMELKRKNVEAYAKDFFYSLPEAKQNKRSMLFCLSASEKYVKALKQFSKIAMQHRTKDEAWTNGLAKGEN